MEKLLVSIEQFCASHELSDSRFGELALNDKNFVRQLREGRDLRMGTVTRIYEFMEKYTSAALQCSPGAQGDDADQASGSCLGGSPSSSASLSGGSPSSSASLMDGSPSSSVASPARHTGAGEMAGRISGEAA